MAAIAEAVSIACARTVVADDKDLFLGEMAISYLAAAPLNVSLSDFQVQIWRVFLAFRRQNCIRACVGSFF